MVWRLALAAALALSAGGCALVNATDSTSGDPDDEDDPIDDEDDDPNGGGFVLKLGEDSFETPTALAVRDVAGNPLPDIAVIDATAQGAHLFVNVGAAQFDHFAASVPAGGWIFAGTYLSDDVTQPGPDLAYVADDGQMTVLDGDGRGNLVGRSPSIAVEPVRMTPVVHQDGTDEILMTDAAGTFRVLSPVGTGHFDDPVSMLTPGGLPGNSLRTADVDLDGDPDVLLALEDMVLLARNQAGVLDPWIDIIDVDIEDGQVLDVVVADFVGDDVPDILALVQGSAEPLVVYSVVEDEYAYVRSFDPSLFGTSLQAGDADGDQRTDIFLFDALAPAGGAQLTVLLATPAWDFGERVDVVMAPPVAAAVDDFDGDGRDDVAVVSGSYADGALEVWCSRIEPPDEE